MLNIFLSEIIKKQFNAQQNECYENCFNAIMQSTNDKMIAKMLYVEGWVLTGTLPYPDAHAWLQIGRHIVDPTLKINISEFPFIKYFPGLWRDRAQLGQLVLAVKENKEKYSNIKPLPIHGLFIYMSSMPIDRYYAAKQQADEWLAAKLAANSEVL